MSGKKEEFFRDFVRPVVAEFIGSVFFIFIACGAAMSTAEKFTLPGTITLGVAFAFGFTLFAIAFTIGHISGGHLNSALTLAFVITGKLSPVKGFFYFLAQLTGGLVGGSLLLALLPVHFRQANCFPLMFWLLVSLLQWDSLLNSSSLLSYYLLLLLLWTQLNPTGLVCRWQLVWRFLSAI